MSDNSLDTLSIPNVFVRGVLSGAVQSGVDPVQLLSAAGISAEVLQNPLARVDATRYARLVRQVWLDLEDEFMGLASVRSKPGTFAIMSLLAIRSRTIGGVMRRAEQFYGLFDNPVVMHIEPELTGSDEGLAALTLQTALPLKDPQHFFQESLLVIWHRFNSWLIGQQLLLDRVEFDYAAPEHAKEYKQIFNCPLHFDCAATRIVFQQRFLSFPVIRDDAELREFLITSPADLLARPADNQSYLARIRSVIGRDLSASLPDFEFVAEQLHLSPQTLRRRLREENTSYQEIKDDLRRDVAIYHLSRPDFPINEIAYQVGFTEASTFHRAFKKWTGLTPGAYREAALAKRKDSE